MGTNVDAETRAVYELSKLTNSSKLIMDDFISTIVISIFKDYIGSYTDPKVALNSFMQYWEENILIQKQEELDILTTQRETMADMVVGNSIASAENFSKFASEVAFIKDMISSSVLQAIESPKDGED